MIKQMMTHATVYVAINELLSEYHKDTGWHINGRIEDFTDLSGVNLANGEDLGFSWSDVEAKIIELDAEFDANKYQRDRQPEYPSYADQFDQIFHEGIDAWKETIQAVKDAHPKPQ